MQCIYVYNVINEIFVDYSLNVGNSHDSEIITIICCKEIHVEDCNWIVYWDSFKFGEIGNDRK